jgi:ATP-dependent RNA helicase DeaD
LQNFESLGLSEPIVKALTELGITVPTAIQQQAIPALLEKATDLLGLAQTGTGKTAAFGLPLIDQIDPKQNAIQAVILSPTRELAQQIAKALGEFAKYIPAVTVDVVYGGTAIMNQIKDLKRSQPKILVATPGRLIDLMNRKVLNLSNVRYVVLDEADEMLNMGFKEDIDVILSFTQEDKNTWLFSATMPKEIRGIVSKYMNNPVEVAISSEEKVNQNIEHRYAMVKGRDKRVALGRIIDAEGDIYCLIFCRTKLSTQALAGAMADQGYPVEAIHGDLSQSQRNTVMRKFKAGSVKILAATDVAARGIDVDNLTHVIHFDLPDDLAFYTHRSGRTGRAGKKGVAISLITPSEQRKIFDLERQLGIKFNKVQIPSAEEVVFSALQSRLDDLLQTKESEDSKVWAHSFSSQLELLSKEDIIAKFFTQTISGLKKEGGNVNAERSDRRDDHGGREDRGRRTDDRRSGGDRFGRSDRGPRSDRGDRPERSDRPERFDRPERTPRGDKDGGSHEENMERFYISIGKDDEVEKADMLKIICDASGVRSRHIGKIQMFQKHTVFDVEQAKISGFVEAFDGLRFNGRKLKVSVDSPSQG